MSNYAKIKTFDIANGDGVRTSIFFSGCEHYCKNCFNSELWDFNAGKPIDENTISIIDATMNEHIQGLSVLGGEPMHPKNIDDLYALLTKFKQHNPTKDVWVWTGYTLLELTQRETNHLNEVTKATLKLIDVLVDGRYIDELQDYNLQFRGSSNQVIWNLKKMRVKHANI